MTSDILKRTAEAALLPCPFCGRAAHLRDDASHSTAAFIGCETEGCFGYMLWAETATDAAREWNQRPDMAAAIAERDAEIARLTARAEAAEAMADRLADAVIGAQQIVLHCEITDGSCCCGEEMVRHSNPIKCGHQPIDHGQYYADKWLEGSVDLISAHATMKEGR